MPHLKKHSIEYDHIAKSQEPQKDVIGNNYIYNLRPLKDLIVSNMNQMKYLRSQVPSEQHNSLKKGGLIRTRESDPHRQSKKTLRIKDQPK
jgi:hypothetical protein